MKNAAVAQRFYQAADVMGLLGENSFKVGAFRNAGRALEALTEDIEVLAQQGRLKEIPGIGQSSAEKIQEFLRTGAIAEFDDLSRDVPAGVVQMMAVPALGLKTVHMLWREAGITSIAELQKRVDDGSLAQLKGFGTKKIDKLKDNLRLVASHSGQHRLGRVLPLAEQFLEALRGGANVVQAELTGGVRRGMDAVEGAELVVAAPPRYHPDIAKAIAHHPGVLAIESAGPTAPNISEAQPISAAPPLILRTARDIPVKITCVDPDAMGAALLLTTGPTAHVEALAQRAAERGWTLDAQGLFHGKKRIAILEGQIYQALGLAAIPAELRDDPESLPRSEQLHSGDKKSSADAWDLVQITDIRGDLHCHTNASDGANSIADVVAEARRRGLQYIAITDHSKSQFQANGLTVERLLHHIAAVRAVAEKAPDILVLAGAEVDILADGSLDYPDDILERLDWVVASPHAALTQDTVAATARLVRVCGNPLVHVIGHPTGRMVLGRRGLEPDMPAVIAAAVRGGVAMEINSSSHRLDLRDSHVRLAVAAGVPICIDTDMHDFVDFEQLRYGILTARRGGATPKNVLNTLPREAFDKWCRRRREAAAEAW